MAYYTYSLKFIPDLSVVKSGGLNPLYVQLIVNRKKALISLQENIDAKHWCYETGRIIKPKTKYEEYLNQKLNRVDNQINAIRLDLETNNEEVSAKKIKSIFQGHDTGKKIRVLDFFAIFIQELTIKKEHTAPVLVHYKQAMAKMESYLVSIGAQDLPLEKFSRKHVVGFETYLKSTPVKILNKPIARNTANNYLKKTKAVFLQSMRQELIKSNPFADFKMHNEATHRTALNSFELNALERYDLSSNGTMQKVKDMFLFSTYCGLRYSDLIALKNENLIFDQESGRVFINIVQQKTKIGIKVPLLATAKRILDKYTDYQKPSAYCFPRISNQKCNSYLREIRGIVGISTKFSFHCSRHTYASTVLLDHGADLKTVSDLLGHYSIVSTEGYSKTSKQKFLNVAESVEAKMA